MSSRAAEAASGGLWMMPLGYLRGLGGTPAGKQLVLMQRVEGSYGSTPLAVLPVPRCLPDILGRVSASADREKEGGLT